LQSKRQHDESGGLTTALFLNSVGFEAEIFERANEILELGVGINMLPHAVKELAGLGLLPDLDAHGSRTRELVYANRLGQVVWQELRGVDAGYEHPQFSIHRGKLLGLIHKAVVERLGRDIIRTGWQVDGFRQTEDGVIVELSDRNGKRAVVSGDLLVGADGIHSAVRGQLYPDEGTPIWNDVMLWRGCTLAHMARRPNHGNRRRQFREVRLLSDRGRSRTTGHATDQLGGDGNNLRCGHATTASEELEISTNIPIATAIRCRSGPSAV
jgi:2-polyprenyl-6-methoxyphenol hydroxylase-like FAD-dependent oxidoreductase